MYKASDVPSLEDRIPTEMFQASWNRGNEQSQEQRPADIVPLETCIQRVDDNIVAVLT